MMPTTELRAHIVSQVDFRDVNPGTAHRLPEAHRASRS